MADEEQTLDFGAPDASTGGAGLFEAKVRDEASKGLIEAFFDTLRDSAADLARGGLSKDDYKANVNDALWQALGITPDSTVTAEDGTTFSASQFKTAFGDLLGTMPDHFYGAIDTAATLQEAEPKIADFAKAATDKADGFIERYQAIFDDVLEANKQLGEEAIVAAQDAVRQKMEENNELQENGDDGVMDADDAMREAEFEIARLQEEAVVYGLPPDLGTAIDNLKGDISQIQSLKGELIAAMKSGNVMMVNVIKMQIKQKTEATAGKIDEAKLAALDSASEKAASFTKAHEEWMQREFGNGTPERTAAIAATAGLYRESPELRKSLDAIDKILGPQARKNAIEADIKTSELNPEISKILKDLKELGDAERKAAAERLAQRKGLIAAHSDEFRKLLKDVDQYGYVDPAQLAKIHEAITRVEELKAQGKHDEAKSLEAQTRELFTPLLAAAKAEHDKHKTARLESADPATKGLINQFPHILAMSPDELKKRVEEIQARKALGHEPNAEEQAIIQQNHISLYATEIGTRKSLVEQAQLLRLEQAKGHIYPAGKTSYDLDKVFGKIYASDGLAKLDAYKSLLDVQRTAGKITNEQYHQMSALLENHQTAPQIAYLLKDAKDPQSFDAALKKIASISDADYAKWAEEERKSPKTLYEREPEYAKFKGEYFSTQARANYDTKTNKEIQTTLATLSTSPEYADIRQTLAASGGIVTSQMYRAVVHHQNDAISPQELNRRFAVAREEATQAGTAYKAMVLSQLSSILTEKELPEVAEYLKAKHGIELKSFNPSDPETQKKLAAFDVSRIPKLSADKADAMYDPRSDQGGSDIQAIALHKLHQTFEGSVGLANAITTLSDRVKADKAMDLETDIDRFFKIQASAGGVNAEEMKYTAKQETIQLRLDYLATQGLIVTDSQRNLMCNILDKFGDDDAKLKQVLTDLSIGTPEQKKAALATMQQTVMAGSKNGFISAYGTQEQVTLSGISDIFNAAYAKALDATTLSPSELAPMLGKDEGSALGEGEGVVKSMGQLRADAAKIAARAAANDALKKELEAIDKKYPATSDRLIAERSNAKQALVQAAAKSGMGIEYKTIHEHDSVAKKALVDATTRLGEFSIPLIAEIKKVQAQETDSEVKARFLVLETQIKKQIEEAPGLSNAQKELMTEVLAASKDADGNLDATALTNNLQQAAKTGAAPDKPKAGEAKAGNDTLVGGADQPAKGDGAVAAEITRGDPKALAAPSPADATRPVVAAAVLKAFVASENRKIDEIASITNHLQVAGIAIVPTPANSAALSAALNTPANIAALTAPAALHAVQAQISQLAQKEISGAVLSSADQTKLATLEIIQKLQQNLLVANAVAATIEHQHQVAVAAKTAHAVLTPEQIAKSTLELMQKANDPILAARLGFVGETIGKAMVANAPETAKMVDPKSAPHVKSELQIVMSEIKQVVDKHIAATTIAATKGTEVVIAPAAKPAADVGPAVAAPKAAVEPKGPVLAAADPKAPHAVDPKVAAAAAPKIEAKPVAEIAVKPAVGKPDPALQATVDRAARAEPTHVAAKLPAVTEQPKPQAAAVIPRPGSVTTPADYAALDKPSKPAVATTSTTELRSPIAAPEPKILLEPTASKPAAAAKPKDKDTVVADATVAIKQPAPITPQATRSIAPITATPADYNRVAALTSTLKTQEPAATSSPRQIGGTKSPPVVTIEGGGVGVRQSVQKPEPERVVANDRKPKTEGGRDPDPYLAAPARVANAGAISQVSFNSDGKPEFISPSNTGQLSAPRTESTAARDIDPNLHRVALKEQGVTGGESVDRGSNQAPGAAADPQVKKTKEVGA